MSSAMHVERRLLRPSRMSSLLPLTIFVSLSLSSVADTASDFGSEFLRQADPASEFRLARFYLMEGAHQDLRLAFDWALRAAEMGHPDAQFTLATFYYSGKGVGASREKALQWFRKAAEQGHLRA